MTEETKAGRTLVGRVVSNKMNKTVTVLVERQVRHPLYRKYIRRTTKLHVHDENGECGEGDVVEIAHIEDQGMAAAAGRVEGPVITWSAQAVAGGWVGGECHDSDADDAGCGRQQRGAQADVYQSAGRIQAPLRRHW
jgi:small subunit ribosomal protein S17